MLSIIGIVMASVLGGFLLYGGDIHVLIQPSEFQIIRGAGFGPTPLPQALARQKRAARDHDLPVPRSLIFEAGVFSSWKYTSIAPSKAL